MVRKNVLEEGRGVVGEHIQREKKNKRLGGPKRRTVIRHHFLEFYPLLIDSAK
jgi:hypothetical protein